MNVERLFRWIRLVAEVILEVFDRFDDQEMKPERIQIWLQILARVALQVLDNFAGGGQEMKPERIQFWLQLITDFVVAVFAAVDEETGKSGESGTSEEANR